MQYQNVVSGKFIERVTRFTARVEIDGKEQLVHVKNTGRGTGALVAGADVVLEPAGNANRKTAYSLIAVYKGKRLINVDSQSPNQVVYEALTAGAVEELGECSAIKREVTYGNSRFDFYVETKAEKGFLEVKGVNLEIADVVMFPDAPTDRGTKHVRELATAASHGYASWLLLLVQMRDVRYFTPHAELDPAFASALHDAAEAGVRLLAYDTIVTPNSITFGKKVEVRLGGTQ